MRIKEKRMKSLGSFCERWWIRLHRRSVAGVEVEHRVAVRRERVSLSQTAGVSDTVPLSASRRTASESSEILSVLGPSAYAARHVATHDVAVIGASDDDLVAEFRRRYWAALEGKPSFSHALSLPAHHSAQTHGTPALAHDDVEPTSGAVGQFLTDINSVEDAFGVLTRAIGGDPGEAAPIPEILHIFAPAGPECVARPYALPALAQREHHLLGVDSPIALPIAQPLGEQL